MGTATVAVVLAAGMAQCCSSGRRGTLPAPAGSDASVDAPPDHIAQEAGPADAPAEPTPAKPGDAWWQAGHDASQSSRSTATVANPPALLWKVKLDGPTDYAAPVIDDQNRIYVSDSTKLYALDAAGKTRWTWTSASDSGFFGIAGVAIHHDGTVVVAEHGGALRGLSPDGQELYDDPLLAQGFGSLEVSSPVIGKSGNVYVTAQEFYGGAMLFAFDKDGHPLYRVTLSLALSPSGVAEGPDGSLYVALLDSGDPTLSRLVKLRPDGTPVWKRPIGLSAVTPAVAPDGSIWLGRWDKGTNLQRFLPSGSEVFGTSVGFVTKAPAIDAQGNAYVGQPQGLVSVAPDGQQRWMVESGPGPGAYMEIWTRSAISGDGVVVVSDDSGALSGVKNDIVLWSVQRDNLDTGTALYDSVAIGPDGTIYAGSLGADELFAYR